MDENYKIIIAYALTAFIGCMLALIIAGIVVIAVMFFAVSETVEFGKAIIVNEFEEMSITCSEAYSADALVLTLNGVAQYCVISKQPEIKDFALDLT